MYLTNNQYNMLKRRLLILALLRKDVNRANQTFVITLKNPEKKILRWIKEVNLELESYLTYSYDFNEKTFDTQETIRELTERVKFPRYMILKEEETLLEETPSTVEMAVLYQEAAPREWIYIENYLEHEVKIKLEELRRLYPKIDKCRKSVYKILQGQKGKEWLLYPEIIIKKLGSYTLEERLGDQAYAVKWIYIVNKSLQKRREKIYNER